MNPTAVALLILAALILYVMVTGRYDAVMAALKGK
jgi:hypothetical protein